MIEDVLKRDDKIALSGGKRLIWAPEFPRYAHKLGFWDYAYYLNYPIAPLYTVTILDDKLNEIPLNRIRREWLPSHLTHFYIPFEGIEVKEEKALLQNDVLVSRITLKNTSSEECKLRAVMWTGQITQENITHQKPDKTPNANYLEGVEYSERLFAFQRRMNNERGDLLIRYGMAIGTRRRANSFSISKSEYVWNYPEWELTPFYEKMTPEGLPNDFAYKGIVHQAGYRDLLYLAQEYPIVLAPGTSHELHIFCAIRDEQEEAMEALVMAAQFTDPVQHSVNTWQRFFDTVPDFRCSDPYLEKYYWYRWFGLRKNMVNTDTSFGLPYPCIFEGTNPSELRHQTSFSASAHILETRWMHNPDIAKGSLLNFIANQRKNGSFPGIISTGYHTDHLGFYHTNWGKSIRELYRVHPDIHFLEQIYQSMKKYAKYFENERDFNSWHLFDILSAQETGLEYSSRYLFGTQKGDDWRNIRLKGVDVTVYIYELYQTLAWMAQKLGETREAKNWEAAANLTKTALLKFMWNGETRFFADLHPVTGKHSPAKPASSFYPFMTDLVSAEHLPMLTGHLFNPAEFWTPFPVPSTSLDDAHCNVNGEWQNMRRARPSNGRCWMLINSHLGEALAHTAQHLAPDCKAKAVEFINNFVKMLFKHGNVKYPTAYEYYNPINGKPPYFRGSDDHINSWMIDLIIKYVAGLQPQDDGVIVIDPLPFELEFFRLENVRVKGHDLKIIYYQGNSGPAEQGLSVYVDGELKARSEMLARLTIEVGESEGE
ncbi:hypothetical protein L0128_14400 [candidate division KSB1 bacterium]|nr:hypothetical protein [candidate division KSB1 bacterium]